MGGEKKKKKGAAGSSIKQQFAGGGSDFATAAIRNSQREKKVRRSGSISKSSTESISTSLEDDRVPGVIGKGTRSSSMGSSSSGSSSSSYSSGMGSEVTVSGSGSGHADGSAESWWEHQYIRCGCQDIPSPVKPIDVMKYQLIHIVGTNVLMVCFCAWEILDYVKKYPMYATFSSPEMSARRPIHLVALKATYHPRSGLDVYCACVFYS